MDIVANVAMLIVVNFIPVRPCWVHAVGQVGRSLSRIFFWGSLVLAHLIDV